MNHLVEYVTLEAGHGFEMSTGRIAPEDIASFLSRQGEAGSGIRMFHRGGDLPATAARWMTWITDILSPSPDRTATDIFRELVESVGGDRRGRGRGEPRFLKIELETRKVTRLHPASRRDLVALVKAWSQAASRDELLVESHATSELLATVLQECGGAAEGSTASRGAVRGAASPLMARPYETDESAALREELARDWLDARAVSRLLGSKAGNSSHMPSRLRRAGRLLGIWFVTEKGYRYPPWQFRHGQPIGEFGEILGLLRGERGVAPGRATSGWEEIEWLCGPHARLGGKRPCDLLADDPQRVLDVARRQFAEDPDARW